MLGQIGVNRFNFWFNTAATLSTAPGISVTPGASDAEGNWVEIAGDADITQDIYLFTLWVAGGVTNAQQKSHLLDIGVDPAGGTSYSEVISNICCGQSVAVGSASGFPGGYFFIFPLFIKAGSAVAVRIQGSNATAGTVMVGACFYGQPSHPELIRVGQYAETIGTITGSRGVAITQGTSGAEGSWTSIGTLAKPCWWFQLCPQFSDAALSNDGVHFDLAYGTAGSKHMIIENMYFVIGTAESVMFTPLTLVNNLMGFADLPAGTELWVRGSITGGTAQTCDVTAVGIGG